MSQWLTPLVPELVSLASNFLAFKVIPPKKNLTYDFCQTFTSCSSFSVLKYKIKRIPYWYLISRFWRDSISRGFIFAISILLIILLPGRARACVNDASNRAQ